MSEVEDPAVMNSGVVEVNDSLVGWAAAADVVVGAVGRLQVPSAGAQPPGRTDAHLVVTAAPS